MSKWDPIGVSDEPMAADEYDSYLGDVHELLERHATADEIARYLHKIETQRMRLTDANGISLMPAEVRLGAVEELQRMFHREKLSVE